MSAGPEPSADLVAVACVVEASLLVASEWSRVLIEYVSPLLKRLSELHPSHQFRLAFVTYGAADTRPAPLLSKRFFAPLSVVSKQLRDEPSKLGIGQTNSGSGRGLSALEGLVAAIELFDILMASTNVNHAQTQSPQKESRSLISHLLHIAASPPDNVQRPQWNTLHHLDVVNWDSIPSELRKRKINLSLINLRKIPQFQDLYSSVAGPGVQSPWFNVRAPHVLLLAGFPAPQKGTKRPTDALIPDHSPDTKRQKVATDSTSKMLSTSASASASASPAPPPARIPQTQRSQQPVAPQATQLPSTTVSSQNPSSAQSVQVTVSAPASTSASASSSAPPQTSGPSLPYMNPEQVVTPTGVKFGQMMERLKTLDKDIKALDSQITNAQSSGQTLNLAGVQKERAAKAHFKEQIKLVLWQHYQKVVHHTKEAMNVQSGSAGPTLPDGSAEAGPSAQPHPPNAPAAPGALSDRSMGPTMEEHKPTIPDPQVLAQFLQPRGGTISAPNGSNPMAGPSQMQPHPATGPETAAQMQKLIEKKGTRAQVLGSASQTPGAMPPETGVHSSATNNQPNQTSIWNGTFLWTFPQFSGQAVVEGQIQALGSMPSSDVRTDTFPQNLTLVPCKEPLKDNEELTLWLQRHKPRLAIQFKSNARGPDGAGSDQMFRALHKFMVERRIYAYTGWRLPSGKFLYSIFIFPKSNIFVGAVFPEGLPDLPGSGNTLDAPSLVEEAKPQPSSGPNMTAAAWARMHAGDPAKRQLLAQMLRVQQELHRQRLQQGQQPHNASGQALNPLGMSMPANAYGAVANIPAGLHGNVSGPANTGAYNTGGGTVNYEMLQSFMQRSAEGSAPQGMNSG